MAAKAPVGGKVEMPCVCFKKGSAPTGSRHSFHQRLRIMTDKLEAFRWADRRS
jgi:hypothetical protein